LTPAIGRLRPPWRTGSWWHYLEASLAMKKQAVEKISLTSSQQSRFRPTDQLLRFLASL